MTYIGIVQESALQEHRVAIVPSLLARYRSLGLEIILEKDAGLAASFADADFQDCEILKTSQAVYKKADIILKVQPPTLKEISHCKANAIMIGFLNPYADKERITAFRDQPLTTFAMELIPRISRAQNMDALSSQASVAGYKGVLLAANLSNRFFPMLTTAAGTIRPTSVLVIGAGVAGLQAIATARRLGAVVEAYDIRAATKEQVESLGAKFIDTGVDASGQGGYARELSSEEKRAQLDVLATHVAKAEIIICTAAIPGRKAPQILSQQMVDAMKRGSVIIDLAAESGGNCELTHPGETYDYQGITIAGPINVASMLAKDASEMYARNLLNFVSLFVNQGRMEFNWNDAILSDSVITHEGAVKHQGILNVVEQQVTA